MKIGIANSLTTPTPKLVSGWLPSDETRLEAWYRFGEGIRLNGDDVSEWEDSSGNGHDMLQAVESKQPAYSNGILTFDDEAFQSLQLWTVASSGGIELTGAFTIGFRIDPSKHNTILLGDVGSANEMVKFNTSTVVRVKPATTNVDFTLSSGNTKDNSYWVLSRDGSDNLTIYKDGAQVDSTQTCTGTFDISQIGQRYHATTPNYFEGDIYEIVIFSTTDEDLITNLTNRLSGL